jgi:uncharacterized protein
MIQVATLCGLVVFSAGVGVLIGGVGVGGVLLAPALITVATLDTHAAVATSSWAFLFTGAIGTWQHARHGTIPWSLVRNLTVGALPAAAAGVLANQFLPAQVILVLIAVTALFAGINALRPAKATAPRPLGTAVPIGAGAMVGFGSALTGTGGPILLVPLLLILGVTPLVAVAAGQVIQVPIVAVASLGYLTTGAVHVQLGSALGIAAAAGVMVGSVAVRRARPAQLRAAVGLACAAAGLLLIIRALPLLFPHH